MIIDSDYDTLTIILSSGKLINRNLDEYNLLKYDDFDGNRIMIKLADGVEVNETFNDGIFNITFKQHKMQLRNKIEIAKRLKYCLDNDTTEPISELMLDNIKDDLKKDVLMEWLKPFYHRIKVTDVDIIIDDMFKVNQNGQAYYKNENKQYNSLCIVAGNITQNTMIKHTLGSIKMDFRTMEIYNKVLFLLFPNMKDSVFVNQLPKYIINRLNKKNKKIGV